MQAAFSYWEDRIAPVFDVARQILLVEVENGKIIAESRLSLSDELPAQKAAALHKLGAEALVCGAISKPLHAVLAGYGIRVIPFVAGELTQVVQAWLRGTVGRDDFVMPGCCRRRQRIEQETFMNNRTRGGGMRQGSGGRGRMGGFSSGAVGVCVCPQCGHRQPHERGVPCTQQQCPNCGVFLTREIERS